MHTTTSFIPRRPLLSSAMALAFGGFFAAHAPGAHAATFHVSNCNDAGSGSLRNAVALASSGDMVDLAALACTRIHLTSGSIAVPQNSLALVGPGATRLWIDPNYHSSIFRHSGTGTLSIKGLTLARGLYSSSVEAFGGCIRSAGNVYLKNSVVQWCRVRSTGFARAFGAGLYATGSVTLVASSVNGNTGIDDGAFNQPEGAGIYTLGRLTAVHSRICGNHAGRAGGASVGNGLFLDYTTLSDNDGGALEATGEALIRHSTISNNKNAWWVVTLDGFTDGVVVAIVDSTLSKNRSVYETVNMSRGTRSILNSTIVDNVNHGGCLNAAVFTTGGPTQIESTIAARNTCDGAPYYDIGGFASDGDSVVGANNLITASNIPVPADTLTVDPRIGPLANHGGPTLTHALLDDSPAISAGNNVAGLAYDQRGPGHPRVIGSPDIGAFER